MVSTVWICIRGTFSKNLNDYSVHTIRISIDCLYFPAFASLNTSVRVRFEFKSDGSSSSSSHVRFSVDIDSPFSSLSFLQKKQQQQGIIIIFLSSKRWLTFSSVVRWLEHSSVYLPPVLVLLDRRHRKVHHHSSTELNKGKSDEKKNNSIQLCFLIWK